MGVCGPLQVTLKTGNLAESTVETWSLPAFAVPTRSASVQMMVDSGADGTGSAGVVFVRSRIAEALAIKDMDEVEILINAIGERD